MSDQLFNISSAIDDLVAERGTQASGRICGIAHTTIMRRGSDLHNWPLTDAFKLADVDDRVRLAIAARLRLHASKPGNPEIDALASVRDAGVMIAGICQALEDKKIHPREARLRLADVRRLLEDLTQLESDLDQRANEVDRG